MSHSGGCPEYFCFIIQSRLSIRCFVLTISASSSKVDWPLGWLSELPLLHHSKSIGHSGGCPEYFCFIIQSRLAIRVVCLEYFCLIIPSRLAIRVVCLEFSASSSQVDGPFGWFVLNISASSSKVDWQFRWLSRIFLLHRLKSTGHSGGCPEYFSLTIQSRMVILVVCLEYICFIIQSRMVILVVCLEYFCFIIQSRLAIRAVVLNISASSSKVDWPFGWLSPIFLLHHPKSIGYSGGCPEYFCFTTQNRLAIRVVCLEYFCFIIQSRRAILVVYLE